MKTILFPTDFSKNATHAAHYAAMLAKLYPVFTIPKNAPIDYPQRILYAADFKKDEILRNYVEFGGIILNYSLSRVFNRCPPNTEK